MLVVIGKQTHFIHMQYNNEKGTLNKLINVFSFLND